MRTANTMIAVTLLLAANAALAQDDEETSAPQSVDTIEVEVEAPQAGAPALPQEAAPRQLDDIVVTAQKTSQSIQQVPVSVTAIDRATIEYTGSNDLADLSLYVPNIRIDADDLGSPQVFIRGFGTNSFNPSFEGSVGFVQDELYFGRPGYFTEAMFDIDRVEVLRGPQGTLFGKNTIAGVFNVASASPPDEFGADLQYKYGSNNEHRVEGGLGGSFADWGGARLSGMYRSEDGETFNRFLDRYEDSLEQRAVRLKVKLFPTHYISSELTLVDSVTDIPFWPFQLFRLDDDTRDYLQDFDPEIEDDPYDYNTSFDTPGWLEKGSSTAGLKTDWSIPQLGALEDFHSILVLGGSRFYIDQLNELDVSPADISRLDSHEDHDQLSAELRFTGRAPSLFGLGDAVEFVAGGFWYDSHYVLLARVLAGADLGSYILTCDFQQLASEDPTVCGGDEGTLPVLPGIPPFGMITAPLVGEDFYQFDYAQDVSALAAFGQFTWYLNEHWAITPGLRFNSEKKRVISAGNAHCPGRSETLPRPCAMEQLLMSNDYTSPELRRDETDVSPKFVLQYFTDAGTNLYVSYTRGFKSGGFNAIAFSVDDPDEPAAIQEDLEYEPEKAKTWELGLKGRWFDRTLRASFTLYDTAFDNLQVLAFNGVFFDVSNAASASSRGLEADFTWLTPLEFLSFTGAFGLTDATYDAYPSAPAPISQGIGALQDLSGQRIAFAPSKTATITPVLTFPVGALLLRFSADAIYQGDQYTDTDLDPNTYVPGYWKYAARAIVASQSESWSLILGGTNLTDERVLNQVTDAVFFPGTFYAQQASGRALFATLALKF